MLRSQISQTFVGWSGYVWSRLKACDLVAYKSPYPQFPTSFPPFPHTYPHVSLIASPVSSFRSNWIFADMAISTGKQRILRIFFVKDQKNCFWASATLFIYSTYIYHAAFFCDFWFISADVSKNVLFSAGLWGTTTEVKTFDSFLPIFHCNFPDLSKLILLIGDKFSSLRLY